MRSPDKLPAFAIFCHMALSCSQLTIKVTDFAQSQSSFMSCHKFLICSQGARTFCTDPNPCYFKRFLQSFFCLWMGNSIEFAFQLNISIKFEILFKHTGHKTFVFCQSVLHKLSFDHNDFDRPKIDNPKRFECPKNLKLTCHLGSTCCSWSWRLPQCPELIYHHGRTRQPVVCLKHNSWCVHIVVLDYHIFITYVSVGFLLSLNQFTNRNMIWF